MAALGDGSSHGHPSHRHGPGRFYYSKPPASPPVTLPRLRICAQTRSTGTEAKEAALRGEWEALPRRRARVVAGEPAARLVLVGDVAVGPTDSDPPRLAERARTQPAFAAEEYAAAERLVVTYPPFRAACAARGIKPEHVRVDPWCAGWYSADDDPARRLGVPMLFVQEIQRRCRGDERGI